jgi:fluoroacetyl-CoA thioesterase
MSFLKPGLLGRAELIVGEEHTAKSVGSGMIGVLATPVMINLIEAAALHAIEAHLPDRCQSLGTYLEVSHVAATPVGLRVCATAELVKVDGRLLDFKVRAFDQVEEIGTGTHRRIVVNVDKFAARVARKTPHD